MFINNRVIHKDNTVLTDLSAILSDPYSGKQAFNVVAAEDALFIGSDFPFNHRFLMLGSKNNIAGSISAHIWGDDGEWVAVEDFQDFTKDTSGIPLAQNGIIRFALPADSSWRRVDDSSEVTALSGLSTPAKANFWLRLTFSQVFTFELEYVGFRFARDLDLNTYYRDLLSQRIREAFNGGTALETYDPVHVVAAEEIIAAIRKEEIAFSGNQLLAPELFTNAACHKLAEIVYSQLKNQERMEFAQAKYREAMAARAWNIDTDGDGREDQEEKQAAWRLRRV